MIHFQQRRSEKKNHETGEQEAMRPTWQAASTHALLAQGLGKKTLQAWL